MLVLPDLLSAPRLEAIRADLAQAAFADGRRTLANGRADLKDNRELAPTPTRERLGKWVIEALGAHPLLRTAVLPHRFSFPMFSKYCEGMHYGFHTDAAILNPGTPGQMRTDLSCTVFLSDPQSYDGGELTVRTDSHESRFKLPAGHAVIYSTSDLHRVEPVTAGERLAAVLWIQSQIRDAGARRTVAKLAVLCDALAAKGLDEEASQASSALHDLIRMWAEI